MPEQMTVSMPLFGSVHVHARKYRFGAPKRERTNRPTDVGSDGQRPCGCDRDRFFGTVITHRPTPPDG